MAAICKRLNFVNGLVRTHGVDAVANGIDCIDRLKLGI